MIRVLLLGAVLAGAAGCGVATPTPPSKSAAPKNEPKAEPGEVYDKVAPMPREVKRD